MAEVVEIVVTGDGGGGGDDKGKGDGKGGDSPANTGQIGRGLAQLLGLGNFSGIGRLLAGFGLDIGKLLGGLFGGGGGPGGGGGKGGGDGKGGASPGGLGPVLAAAGPAGIAVGAMLAIREAGEMVGGAIKGVATTLAGVVEGNFYAPLRALGDKLSDVLTVVSPALGFLSKVVLGVVDAAKVLSDAFLREAQRLQDYSPQTAVAFALADVRKLEGEMREAQALGPHLARLVEGQSRAEETLRELFLPVKEQLAEFAADMMDFTVEVLEWMKEHSDDIKTGASAVGTVADGVVSSLPALGTVWNAAKLLWENRDQIKELMDIGTAKGRHDPEGLVALEDLMKSIDGALGGPGVGPDPKDLPPLPPPALGR